MNQIKRCTTKTLEDFAFAQGQRQEELIDDTYYYFLQKVSLKGKVIYERDDVNDVAISR